MPRILESDESSKKHRKNWARLIREIHGVAPLTCPKRSGKMKVISVIEDQDVIKKILKHLRLWEGKPLLHPEHPETPNRSLYQPSPISIVRTRRSALPIIGFLTSP
jgi:hypothetical protein